jgi:acid phosphatase (class A)
MNPGRRRLLYGAVAVVATGIGVHAWLSRNVLHFLDGDTAPFVALFPPPPARGSPQERAELDLLLALQRGRTAQQVEFAQADRKTNINRFADALGLEPRVLDGLSSVVDLAEDAEDDARTYVRDAKRHFRRLRPKEVEPAIEPCIGDVAADLSYPSGHATWGFLMGYLLADLAPERRDVLLARATEFARQRLVCGVHFPSDMDAGQRGAQWLIEKMRRNPAFIAARERASRELRAARSAVQGSGHSSASRAPPRFALVSADARPRCSAAILATMASPSPNPPVSRLRLVSSRVNAWNTEDRCASGMPSPSSSTTRRFQPLSRARPMRTWARA